MYSNYYDVFFIIGSQLKSAEVLEYIVSIYF